MSSAKQSARGDLIDIAREIFADTADQRVFDDWYYVDLGNTRDFPQKAQECVYEAKDKFFKSNDGDFHIEVGLSPDHNFTNKSSITYDVINKVKPVFAAEYLKHIGSINSPTTVKMVKQFISLTPDNFEIQTRKGGYSIDQLVVHLNPKKYARKIPSRVAMANKCKKIRNNFQIARELIDKNFPIEEKKKVPRPYKINPSTPLNSEDNSSVFNNSGYFNPSRSSLNTTISIRAKSTCSINRMKRRDRCPTSIPEEFRIKRKKPQENPFVKEFPLVLPRSEIESIVQAFSERFDILNYVNAGMKNARDCVNFLRSGTCSRMLFHVAKYMHSILVYNREDLPDFIRARALWHVIYKKIDDSIVTYRFVSIALMMLKACTYVLFEEHSPNDAFSDNEVMQVTVFWTIDRLLNPFQIFDSLEKDENFRVKLKPILLNQRKQILDDLKVLIDDGSFEPPEEEIAKLIVNPVGMNDLLCLLGTEAWGDVAEYKGPMTRLRYNENRMVQKLIAMDIEKLNIRMPRKPPKWIRQRKHIFEAVKSFVQEDKFSDMEHSDVQEKNYQADE